MQELKKYVLEPLVLISALNWGSIGIFKYDFIAAILGNNADLIRIADGAIGLAAVLIIALMFSMKNK